MIDKQTKQAGMGWSSSMVQYVVDQAVVGARWVWIPVIKKPVSRTFGPTFFTKGKLYLAPYEQTEQFRDCSKQIVKEQKLKL